MVAEEVDSGSPFFQGDGGSPGTGLGIAFHIRPLVFRDWLVQERSGTFMGAIIDPPDASALCLGPFFKIHPDTQLILLDLMARCWRAQQRVSAEKVIPEESVSILLVLCRGGMRCLVVPSVRLVIDGHLGMILRSPENVIGDIIMRSRLEKNIDAALHQLVPVFRNADPGS